MISAFVKFWLKRDLQSWRKLRRACMSYLPSKTTTKAAP